jgi:hypothetical protein
VLTGTPILVASRTVNAAPSSIVNPLEVKQVNYISHARNISNSWGRKLTICLYLVLRFNKHILHYAHAPCCFIMPMHHAASLCIYNRKINPVISVTQAVYMNTLHMTQMATECKQHHTYKLHKCKSNHAKRFTQLCSLFSSYFGFLISF